MLSPGDRFDRYVVERLLGEGGMGRVYLARDTRLGRQVALKVLHAGGLGTDGAARLQREARAAAQLSHPNAVAIFDVGEIDGTPYLAMEYLEGRTLRQASFEGTVAAPIATRVRWLTEVARALAAAHDRGLIHRDIKPENVLVRTDGSAKVLDFGIARASAEIDPHAATAAHGALLPTLTNEGVVIGTPVYMAPEQMLSLALDGRADQFSWGVMAFEVLTGRLPWRAANDPVKVIAEVVSAEAAPSIARDPVVPPAVAAIVDRALAKDKSVRFSSMHDLVRALEAATTDARDRASPPGPKATGRSRVSATLLTIALVGVAAFGIRQITRGRAASTTPPPIASVRASSAPTVLRMTDVPMPTSQSAEAIAAYRRGLQDFHDANIAHGHEEMSLALKLDPGLAAAHLREVIYPGADNPSAHRAAVHQLRSALSARDQAILAAWEPSLPAPIDMAACAARTKALADGSPGDVELALIAMLATTHEEAHVRAARALALDPELAIVHWALAVADEGRRAMLLELRQCIAISPRAGSCRRVLAVLDSAEGKCEAAEASLAETVRLEPDDGYARLTLLGVALGRGAGRPEADAFVATAEASAFGGKPWPFGRAVVAVQFGDFSKAIALLEAAPVRDRLALLLLYVETGDASRAANEVRAYLADHSGGESGSLGEGAQGALFAFDYARASGSLPLSTLRTQALAWRDAEPDPAIGAAWVAAAAPGPLPAEVRRWATTLSGVAAIFAETALLLFGRGDDDEAFPLLTAAAPNCWLSESLILLHRPLIRLALGDVRARKGDLAGACAAFAQVTAQWGKATPRSVTAERAAAQAKALKCTAP